MDLIEKLEQKFSKTKKIEERLKKETQEFVDKANKNLLKLENRFDVEPMKEEILVELSSIRQQLIDDLRSYAHSLDVHFISKATIRINDWHDLSARNFTRRNEGQIISSASSKVVSNDVFQDEIACSAICLIDCNLLTSKMYKEQCLDSMSDMALFTIASAINLSSRQNELSRVLNLLSSLNRYQVKPIQKQVCKLVFSNKEKEDTIATRVLHALNRLDGYHIDFKLNEQTGRLEKTNTTTILFHPNTKHKLTHIKALKRESLTPLQQRELNAIESKLKSNQLLYS